MKLDVVVGGLGLGYTAEAALDHPDNSTFYAPTGLRHLAANLHPGDVFAMWSNDPPDDEFMAVLKATFVNAQAHIVTFHNPLQDREATCTVYVAYTAANTV